MKIAQTKKPVLAILIGLALVFSSGYWTDTTYASSGEEVVQGDDQVSDDASIGVESESDGVPSSSEISGVDENPVTGQAGEEGSSQEPHDPTQEVEEDENQSTSESEDPVLPQTSREDLRAGVKLSATHGARFTNAEGESVDLDVLWESLPAEVRRHHSVRPQLIRNLKREGYVSSARNDRVASRMSALSRGQNPESFIIGGDDARIADAPWQVALVYSGSRNLYLDQFCGGSIIDRKWVVTAAHCVESVTARDIEVVSGLAELPSRRISSAVSKVRNIIIHPMWFSEEANFYDIALLELSRPLRLSTGVREKIELASNAMVSSPNSGRISGWGLDGSGLSPANLQYAQTAIIDCPEGSIFDGPFDTTPNPVCIGSEDGTEADVCFGDSGGPLAVASGDQWYLLGVTAFGENCPPAGVSAFTDIRVFNGWIMCHSVPARGFPTGFGGPYFCGDEGGYIAVGDTLKFSPGGWGDGRYRIQWFADGLPIRGATKPSLVLRSPQYQKTISVAVSVRDGTSFSYEFIVPVSEATKVQVYDGRKFVPCTKVSGLTLGTLGGKCDTRRPFGYGALLSYPGVDRFGNSYSFWAYRDFRLPKNTLAWSWGVVDAWATGAGFYGAAIGQNPLNSSVEADWYFEPTLEPPIDPVLEGPLSFDAFQDEEYNPFTEVTVRGNKARVLMGTDGNIETGAEFDFGLGLIVAFHF